MSEQEDIKPAAMEVLHQGSVWVYIEGCVVQAQA
jgi:hypothetical protein